MVAGTAGDGRRLAPSESIHVPLGAIHRLEGPGRLPMVLLDVQTGSYLGEDDIIPRETGYDTGGLVPLLGVPRTDPRRLRPWG